MNTVPIPKLVRDLVHRFTVPELLCEESVSVVGILDLRNEDGPAHLKFANGLKWYQINCSKCLAFSRHLNRSNLVARRGGDDGVGNRRKWMIESRLGTIRLHLAQNVHRFRKLASGTVLKVSSFPPSSSQVKTQPGQRRREVVLREPRRVNGAASEVRQTGGDLRGALRGRPGAG